MPSTTPFNKRRVCRDDISPKRSELSEAIGRIGLTIDKVFVTKYDGRKILNRNVLDTIQNSLGDAAFRTTIRENVALAEAPTQGLDIFRYAPRSIGADDYRALAKEIMERP